MKKVMFYVIATIATIATANVTLYMADYIMHFANCAEMFQRITSRVFIKYIEYFASIGCDLLTFRVIVYSFLLAGVTMFVSCIVAAVFDAVAEKAF